jgi:hypothetical protein
MSLGEFINDLFSNIMTQEGIDRIIDITKNEMKDCGKNYSTAKVESQVLTENDNYAPDVSISSDHYDDGEIIFIDFYIDKLGD